MKIQLPVFLLFTVHSFFAFSLGSCTDKEDIPVSGYTQKTYFIDSQNGNDAHSGTSKAMPWKSLSKVENAKLLPGDSVRFKRGSTFTGPLVINISGSKSKYIILTDYGDSQDPAPSFTNPIFEQGNFGNCIRIKGDYVEVSNLYFHHTSAYKAGNYQTDGWTTWEMGAIYIDKGAENCIVRNNEMFDCLVGIKSYGKNSIIENNYVHDCNRILAEWNWGPIGIWLGADYQEVRYNRIINISAVDPHIDWGNGTGGADGGAFEIDDARNEKTHISIHHNYTRECQGFLEVTWKDVLSNPKYENFHIHHNVSDDYQQFIALWRGANCKIENNTIIRRRQNPCNWGVFNITQSNSKNVIKNNIVIVEGDTRIFNVGLGSNNPIPSSIIENNLFFAASGVLDIGKEGPGLSPVYGDPKFVNYVTGNKADDFALQAGSPAINKGLDLGYLKDFVGTAIPQFSTPDIGAFEYK